MVRLVVLTLAGMLSFSTAVHGRDSTILEPSSQWILNYADDSCRLARTFGEGDFGVYLYFERFGPRQTFTFFAAGHHFRRRRANGETTILLGPDEHPVKFSYTGADLPNEKGIIGTSSFHGEAESNADEISENTEQTSPLNEASSISFGRPFEGLILNTGSLDQPMQALDQCIEELLGHWGIDVEAHRTISRAVAPADKPEKWLTPSDYPKAALRKGQQALVNFRLIVSDDGEVESCHIQRATKPEGFDDIICELISQRAKFHPALDSEGMPIRSFYINSVRMIIP